jgi:hypothetical protein
MTQSRSYLVDKKQKDLNGGKDAKADKDPGEKQESII